MNYQKLRKQPHSLLHLPRINPPMEVKDLYSENYDTDETEDK